VVLKEQAGVLGLLDNALPLRLVFVGLFLDRLYCFIVPFQTSPDYKRRLEYQSICPTDESVKGSEPPHHDKA
jgi:hypothetical protein